MKRTIRIFQCEWCGSRYRSGMHLYRHRLQCGGTVLDPQTVPPVECLPPALRVSDAYFVALMGRMLT